MLFAVHTNIENKGDTMTQNTQLNRLLSLTTRAGLLLEAIAPHDNEDVQEWHRDFFSYLEQTAALEELVAEGQKLNLY